MPTNSVDGDVFTYQVHIDDEALRAASPKDMRAERDGMARAFCEEVEDWIAARMAALDG